MTLEFENAIAIQPVEGSGSGLQFQNTIYIQPKDEGGGGGGGIDSLIKGFTYNTDNTGLLCAGVTDNTKAYVDAFYKSGNERAIRTMWASSITEPSNKYEALWSAGYIDIPYSFGQVVGGGKTSATSVADGSNIIFGKLNNDEFIPILVVYPSGSFACCYVISNTSYRFDSYILYQVFDGTELYKKSSVSTISTYPETTRAYGSLCQLIDTGSSFEGRVGFDRYFVDFSGQSITPEQYNLVKEITTARIMSGSDTGTISNPLLIDGIGLWDYDGTISVSTFTTENALGQNLLL